MVLAANAIMSLRLLVVVIAVLATNASAQTFRSRTHFAPARIGVTTNRSLQAFIAGKPLRAQFGKQALRAAGKETVSLGAAVHRLMPDTPVGVERVLITPTHVALIHGSGLVDLVRRQDARSQIATRTVQSKTSCAVGIGVRGFPINATRGPADTILLYRQLPTAARGEVASRDGNTSFALGQGDAYHPFGTAGKTVRLAMPRATFDRAVQGTEGAVGWNNLGDGYSTGLEVLTEVQIPSSRIRELFH